MTGLFSERGKPLCAIRTASGMVTITSSERMLLGFLGNSNLTVSETPTRFASKASPLLWKIAVPEIGSGIVKVWKSKRAGKPLDDFLKGMEKSRAVKVKVLEDRPEELVENKPRECRASLDVFQGLKKYQQDIRSVTSMTEETKELAESLMRMRMPDNMWGIKEVKKHLAKVKGDMDSLDEDYHKFEIASESTDRRTDMTKSLIRKGFAKKDLLANSVTGIVKDFFVLKSFVSKMAQSLHPLSEIDKVFKKATGYPTTWAFDPATFYDFQYCYDGLIKSLVRMAKAELSTVEPLFVWKVQSMGENNVRLSGT